MRWRMVFQCKLVGLLILVLLMITHAEAVALGSQRKGNVAGVVSDISGAVIGGATVRLQNVHYRTISSTVTDRDGLFTLARVPFGVYQIVVSAKGFAERRLAVRITAPGVMHLNVTLRPGLIRQTVTVTAEPGLAQERRAAVQPVNVIGKEQLLERSKAVLAEAMSEEVGVQVQRTSSSVGGVHIRGLGGSRVNVFVDGIRYSTSAARGGINTFLNLADPTHLDAIEVLRGPESADYGSDALGGSLQLISRVPELNPAGRQWHGRWGTSFNTSDGAFGSHLATSLTTEKLGVFSNLVGRRVNRIRPGGGFDSHSAVARFLGLQSSVIQGSRLPDTAFTQYGGLVNLIWTPRPNNTLSLHFQRGQQDGGKRYDQLLGGDGNLIADVRNLMLDFFYVRYQRQGFGWFDDVTLSYSFNSQREERVNQGGNGDPQSPVVTQYEKTRVHGLQFGATKLGGGHQLRLGAEVYYERIRSPSFATDPVTESVSLRRPRVPDRAQYHQWGVYAQDTLEIVDNRLTLIGALRYSGASYRARAVDAPVVAGRPLWPSETLRVDDLTGRAGALLRVSPTVSLSFQFSRGFRSPNMTDLGTLGLTGSGFEVAAGEAARLGGRIGSTADTTAISTGRPVIQLRPEVSMNYDVGVRFYHQRVKFELDAFINDIDGLIAKQALVLPPEAVGLTLGGEPIVDQTPAGVVFVSASANPVLVRANFDDVRLWGLEQSTEVALTHRLAFIGKFTYLRAEERRTGVPPNISAGTPPPDAWLQFHYHTGGRFWIESAVHLVDRQSRMSSLMLRDRRIGAGRSLESIARFFHNGATVRGLVGSGPDGVRGTLDDTLLATGETLAQVQTRVLGPGVRQSFLFQAIPGYVTFNIRGGIRLSETHLVSFEVENVTDRNYRGVSWGIDGPGRSLSARYQVRF